MALAPRALLVTAVSAGGIALVIATFSFISFSFPALDVASFFNTQTIHSSPSRRLYNHTSSTSEWDRHLSTSQYIDSDSLPFSAVDASDISNRIAGSSNQSNSTLDFVYVPNSPAIITMGEVGPSQEPITNVPVPVSTDGAHVMVLPKVSGFASSNASFQLVPDSFQPPAGLLTEIGTSFVPLSGQQDEANTSVGNCDLFKGKWFYDEVGPLYTNSSCPIITQLQNCQGNGRPDRNYENWRWKPTICNLPRFDVGKFLDLMKGKTLAFVGDSVARNQFESMLCILWQVEVPRNLGSRKMHRWYFRSVSFSLVRVWSSWLVHHTTEAFQWAPQGVVKLHLDYPDEKIMELLPRFDIVVLSSGHWFVKQSVYILRNNIVGGQVWWPNKTREMQINNVEAFGISMETILTSFITHPNYTGLTIVRSFSPDHYEGGAWNTGGSCTGNVQPASSEELARNQFTDVMHAKQVASFEKVVKAAPNGSKLRLMDITEMFSFRHDGHPGPYRSKDPNKITQKGPTGKLPPQDCLHWCMPGPVDTWNEMVLEIIHRERKSGQ